MKLLMCNCRYCKAGRKSKGMQRVVETKRGGVKRRCKVLLARGDWELLPVAVAIGYTD